VYEALIYERWQVYSNLATPPQMPHSPAAAAAVAMQPLSLFVPAAGAHGARAAAVLLVKVLTGVAKGARVSTSIAHLFGCGLKEAGIRVAPASPLSKRGGRCIYRDIAAAQVAWRVVLQTAARMLTYADYADYAHVC
jgi:hypothetical protein